MPTTIPKQKTGRGGGEAKRNDGMIGSCGVPISDLIYYKLLLLNLELSLNPVSHLSLDSRFTSQHHSS